MIGQVSAKMNTFFSSPQLCGFFDFEFLTWCSCAIPVNLIGSVTKTLHNFLAGKPGLGGWLGPGLDRGPLTCVPAHTHALPGEVLNIVDVLLGQLLDAPWCTFLALNTSQR